LPQSFPLSASYILVEPFSVPPFFLSVSPSTGFCLRKHIMSSGNNIRFPPPVGSFSCSPMHHICHLPFDSITCSRHTLFFISLWRLRHMILLFFFCPCFFALSCYSPMSGNLEGCVFSPSSSSQRAGTFFLLLSFLRPFTSYPRPGALNGTPQIDGFDLVLDASPSSSSQM